MKVRAVFGGSEFGVYDNRRRFNNDQFDLDKESDFSPVWMEWITPPKKSKPKKKPVVEEQAVEVELNPYPEPEPE